MTGMAGNILPGFNSSCFIEILGCDFEIEGVDPGGMGSVPLKEEADIDILESDPQKEGAEVQILECDPLKEEPHPRGVECQTPGEEVDPPGLECDIQIEEMQGKILECDIQKEETFHTRHIMHSYPYRVCL